LGDNFINDDNSSKISSYHSSESGEEEEEPMYKLRARRSVKNFTFQEYDDMINSAIQVEDEYEEEGAPNELDALPPVPAPPRPSVGRGKVMGDEDDVEEEEKVDGEDEEQEDESERHKSRTGKGKFKLMDVFCTIFYVNWFQFSIMSVYPVKKYR